MVSSRTFLVTFFCVFFSAVMCAEQGPATDSLVKQLSDQEFGTQLQALLSDTVFQDYVQHKHGFEQAPLAPAKDAGTQATGSQTAQHKQNTFDFYQDYIKKYYPKVFVIRELFFERMSPEQIAHALEVIIRVFSEQPWFYFVDTRNQIKLPFYWEYILDQLSFMSEFLCLARVDTQTQRVWMPENDKSAFYSSYASFLSESPGKGGKSQELLGYLLKQGHTVVYDFYALSFDYVIKIFNEGILLKNIAISRRALNDLEYMLKKLHNSIYEQDYQDVVKTCKELLARLKTQKGVDDLSQMQELFGDDADGQKLAKESAELGYA